MAHHKRRKPKAQRAGCIYCKHWKYRCTTRVRRLKARDRRKLGEHRGSVLGVVQYGPECTH